MEKPMIEVHDIKKKYRMGQIGGGTLTADLQSWWARVRKKEDPNIPIGTNLRLLGHTFMALNGVSFEVHAGEALGIIGGNGAGKSTLLKLLSRITAPSQGEITLRGRVASMLEVGTGFNGEMTGRENIYMNGAILGMTKGEIESKLEDIIAFSECEDFIDTPVKRYSSGMYVKLAFAVAAHLASEIMIMDEVLAVGDAKFQKKCLAKMRDESISAGRTILYVSHNMSTIRELCTRCIVLKEGKIIFDGPTEDAIAVYEETSISEFQMVYDLSQEVHPDPIYGQKLKILEFRFEQDDTGMYNENKPVRFFLKWEMRQAVDNLRLKICIFFKDGTPVTFINSEPLDCALVNPVKIQSFCLSVKHFLQGDYYFRFYLIESFLDGKYIAYDGTNTKFPLRISNEHNVWCGYGHVMLPSEDLYAPKLLIQ